MYHSCPCHVESLTFGEMDNLTAIHRVHTMNIECVCNGCGALTVEYTLEEFCLSIL